MAHGIVYLVGAGPGHPGLLTLRAVDCLRQADLVLYDRSIPDALLEHALPSAAKVCVAELSPRRARRHLPIHETMIAAARLGKKVVRLKGGDPCLFGRGAEEAHSLFKAGVPFEIVPGVTAALGAAAFAGIPLTHRQHASAVAFVTGHENPGNPDAVVDWSALARFPGTLVIYTGMSRLRGIVQALIEGGKDPGTPAAVVHWASTGEQRTATAPLHELVALIRTAGMTPPALIFIGSVVSLREELAWFEKLPLFGKRILVTRPRHQAGDLVQRLIALGAAPLVLPVIEITDPAESGPADEALRNLASYDWLVFTSGNGVHFFMKRLFDGTRDLRVLGRIKLAAIGSTTAEALQAYHLRPDLVPAKYRSEDLAAALKDTISPMARVLLARAEGGREVLYDTLAKVCSVTQVAVYSQASAIRDDDPILDLLRRGEIDFVTLTSSNIARGLFRRLDAVSRGRLESGQTRLVSISPLTSADIRLAGLPVAGEASRPTMDGLVEALKELGARDGSGRGSAEAASANP